MPINGGPVIDLREIMLFEGEYSEYHEYLIGGMMTGIVAFPGKPLTSHEIDTAKRIYTRIGLPCRIKDNALLFETRFAEKVHLLTMLKYVFDKNYVLMKNDIEVTYNAPAMSLMFALDFEIAGYLNYIHKN